MSSRAYLVDLIHSIGEKTALADHLEEKLGTEDDEIIEKMLPQVLNLRREQMNLLLENAERPNPEYWCTFKHCVKAWTLDTEVYEANPTDETKAQMVKSSEILAMATSLFLGMDFETCARCLYDKMLVSQIENNKHKKEDR